MKIKKYPWSEGLNIQIDDSGNYFIDQKNDIYDMFPDDILSSNWIQYK